MGFDARQEAEVVDLPEHPAPEMVSVLVHRRQVEDALVTASRMLVSGAPLDLSSLLDVAGTAVGADCAYFAPTPPDEELTGRPERNHGTSIAHREGTLPGLALWARPGGRSTTEWNAVLDAAGMPGAGKGAEPAVPAVPVLSSQGRLFGYLGFIFEQRARSGLDEDARVLSVLGDLLSAYLERKETEARLAESEDRWRCLVEHNPEPILVVADQAVIYANGSAAGLLAQEHVDELVGRSIYDFVSAEDFQALQAALQAVYERGEALGPREQVVYRLDGEERIVEWYLVPALYSGRRAAQIVLRDITRRKAAERALQESELRFRLMADSAPVLIWMAGPDGRCSYFNQTWLAFTGRSLDEELGDGWTGGIHPDDVERCFSTFITACEHRQPFRMEYRLRRADGVYRWMLETGVPRHSDDGTFLGLIGSCVDLTEQKLAMEALRESEERYRTFIETISEGIWRMELAHALDVERPVDEQVWQMHDCGIIAESNDSFARLLGRSTAAELNGQTLGQVAPCLEVAFLKEFVEMGYHLRNREYRVERPGQDMQHLVINAVGVVEAGRLIRVWGSCVDVTERVELEQQMVAALEQQQQRFGRDLHDGVGQLLTAVRMLSSNLAERFLSESIDGAVLANKVVRFAEEASQRVREIYSGLAPFQLYQDGLSVVLRDLAADINSLPGPDCTYIHDGVTDVREKETMLHLYRIVQEATNNALKYARAAHVSISLLREGDDVVLQIQDDGQGFDIESRRNGKSLGLRSMFYRARAIGGTLSIVSETGQSGRGTTVRCIFPARGGRSIVEGRRHVDAHEPFL